jgi:hypothetical protein
MSAGQLADVQSRLQVTMRDICASFVKGGLEEEKAAQYEEMIQEKGFKDFLDISSGYSKTMAYIDHEEMVKLLTSAWVLWLDALTMESKIVKRKVMAMEADSKQAGTPQHEKQQKIFDAIERNRKNAMMESSKYRIASCLPLQPFIDDNKYDATQDYKEYKARTT